MSSLVQNPDFVEVIYVEMHIANTTQSKFCQCVSSILVILKKPGFLPWCKI
jgi:hypothetical protein